jgi:hypothetical protein
VRHRFELPSAPAIGLIVLIVAAVVFMATRPHDDREQQRLIDAVHATYERGGEVMVTDYKNAPSIGEHVTTNVVTTPPGTDPMELTDSRTIVAAVDSAVSIESVGTETIDGATVTHYTAVMEDDGEGMSAMKARPSRIDVWIDASGLMRRYKLEDWFDRPEAGVLDSYIALDFSY